MARSAEGLLSVKKSRCTSTSMGSTLLHSAYAHSSGEAGCDCRAACPLTWAHRIHGLLLQSRCCKVAEHAESKEMEGSRSIKAC